MASIFSKVISGEFPARFVYRDERAVAFLTIAPITAGHTLVVPVAEVDHWIDLPADDWAHVQAVAQKVGAAIQDAFSPVKVASIVAGLEVPHVHVHLIPFDTMEQLDFRRADADATPEDLDAAAANIRAALRARGIEAAE